MNSSDFSHEEKDFINKSQINRVSEVESSHLIKNKINKHQRGYSGPIQRNLQSITEEDEKSMLTSLRKRQEEASKEKETINEKYNMTDLNLLQIHTKNDKTISLLITTKKGLLYANLYVIKSVKF